MRPSKAQTGESMDRPNIIQDEDINVSSPNNQQPESVGRHFAAIPAPSVSGLDEERCRESPLTTQSKATENASDIPESILLQQNTRVSHLQIGSSDDSIKNESDLKPDQAGGDRSFKVSPLQSIELASATFGGSYRIPLTLYYATDELRVRGDICTVIDELFQENWDEKDEAFDALVEVFNTRPFKQDLYFSAADSVQHCVLTASAVRGTPGSSELDTLVQSLGMEPALSYLPEQETGLRGESPPEITAANAIPNVASKDLSRIILRFLSDLPHPLIPDDVFTAFSDTIRLQTADPIKIQMSSLLVQSLPDEQQQLLQFLLEFLDDIILKPLQDHIQVCEHASSDVADRDDGHKEKMQLYKKTIARISEVFGIVCTHATTSELSGSMSHTMETPIESSLYRYYKVMSERKGIQEKLATVVNKAQTVFHYLLQNRVGIFGSFSFSLHSLGATGHPAKRIGASDIDTNGQGEDVNEALLCKCDDDTNYGHQSDNAYLDRPTTLLESRERQYQKSGSCANQCPCKPAGRSRHFHKCAIQGKAFAQRVVEPTTAISDTGNIGDDMPSSRPNATCDSAMEETVIVDTLAEAAMRVHAAQSLRLQRHLPHPSLETLHSIMAETDSIMGVLDQKQCEDQHGGNEEKQKTKFGLESTDSPQGSTNRKRQEHEIRIVEKEILQSVLDRELGQPLPLQFSSEHSSRDPALGADDVGASGNVYGGED
ncbi:hypothetical protein BC939DRAFT_475103 [Gamsiella multidivaricata]|uniref:uncharacterized protein n=1 Tax=Gamsiella multidivaricata TaxID=101098 RepID=UPI002220DE4C|nr:uncharacterized protein BC939DRAFT_475103 [Gamsiella multidivaricata]KAI7828076.1 hypothetical protein BC939DRAFT_475103 [Gamsiella multidivaricata]